MQVMCGRVILLTSVFATVVAQPALGQSPREICDTVGVSEREYRRVLNREFAALLSPQSGNLLGNFIGLDLKEAEASVAATSVFKSGNILGSQASGGAANGLLPIVTATEINPKFSAQVQYNFVSRRGLSYTDASCVAYYRGRQIAFRADTLRQREISADYDTIVYHLKLTGLRENVSKIKAAAETATGLRRDSLNVELEKAEKTVAHHLEDIPLDVVEQQFLRRTALSGTLRKLEDTLQVTGFSLGWVSIGYELENVTFKQFAPSAEFGDQVKKNSDVSHFVSLRYSHYTSSTGQFESRFLTFAVRAGISNNLGDLTKTELVEQTDYGAPPSRRFAEKKYTAVEGEFRDGVKTATLNADAYQFLLPNNRGALHASSVFTATESRKPTLDASIGLLVVGKNTGKDSAFANAELYWNMKDVFNTQKSDDGVIKRSGLGVRLTFPLNFQPEF